MPTRRNPIQHASYMKKIPTVNPLKASKNKHILHANYKSQHNNFILSTTDHHEWRDKSQHTCEKSTRKIKSTTIFPPTAKHN
jgi:hypothetical protein